MNPEQIPCSACSRRVESVALRTEIPFGEDWFVHLFLCDPCWYARQAETLRKGND